MRSRPLILALLAGCVGEAAQIPALSPQAADVRVGKSDPDPSCREIGPIEVAHGHGCGGFGEVGNYEGAYNVLRNQASARGATYVRMDAQEPPHTAGGCFVDAYVIHAVAFACTATATTAAPPPAP